MKTIGRIVCVAFFYCWLLAMIVFPAVTHQDGLGFGIAVTLCLAFLLLPGLCAVILAVEESIEQ